MREKHLAALETMGLSVAEAQIYLTLLRSAGPMRASAVVTATGVPRSSVYPTLSALADKGFVEAETGYGGRFSAVPVEQALPSLVGRARKELAQREQAAGNLIRELKSRTESNGLSAEAEQIQVLRDPRVFAERFERLQGEARRQIDIFVKSPILNPSYSNPAQERAMKRGVRVRGLYERSIVDAPEIKPYLAKWIAAGEDARVYKGELPHKLAIFDGQNILLPLVPPGGGAGRILFIRHPQLAASLGMLFEFLWQRSRPIQAYNGNGKAPATKSREVSAVNKVDGSNPTAARAAKTAGRQ